MDGNTEPEKGDSPRSWEDVFLDELKGLSSSDYAQWRTATRRADGERAESDTQTARDSEPPVPEADIENLRGALLGLALSGGGIRSASFALGVIQTFMRFGVLERFHYLSSVSGGGYMAIALAWLRKRSGEFAPDGKNGNRGWQQQLTRIESGARTTPPPADAGPAFDKATKSGDPIQQTEVADPATHVDAVGGPSAFTSGSNTFATGVHRVADPINSPPDNNPRLKSKPPRRGPGGAIAEDAEPQRWLDYLRQHGNYLQPPRMGALSLAGVAIRNGALGFGIYFSALVLALVVLLRLDVVSSKLDFSAIVACRSVAMGMLDIVVCRDAPSLLVTITVALLVLFVGYSFATFILSLESRWSKSLATLAATSLALLLMLWSMQVTPDFLTPTQLSEPTRLLLRWCVLTSAAGAVVMGLRLLSLGVRKNQTSSEKPGKAPASRQTTDTGSHVYRMRVSLQILTVSLLAIALVLAGLVSLPWAWQYLERAGTISMSVLATLAAAYQAFGSRTRALSGPVASRVRVLITAALVLAAAVLVAFAMARAWQPSLPVWCLLATVLLLVAFCTNLNQFGLARMYRDRLMETFMPNLPSIQQTQWSHALDADGSRFGLLQNLWPAASGVDARLKLYPLVNTNVVLIDSNVDTWRGRGGDSFVLSPFACGSDATQWIDTRYFADRELTAATAMATSGAAANPNAGPGGRGLTRSRLVSFLMFLTQARLGLWVRNPFYRPAVGTRNQTGWRQRLMTWLIGQRPNFLFPGIVSGLFGRQLNERAYFLELTDGGHFDNTGAYELIRRRAKLIVIASAGQDTTGGFADLANLIEKVRVDFGVHFFFDDGMPLNALIPDPPAHAFDRPCVKRGHAIARLFYPRKRDDEDDSCGWLVYLHATPITGLSADVESYRHHQPGFPHQSTGDQFFDEAQLEAHRELGYSIAKRFMSEVMRAAPAEGDAAPAGFQPGNAMSDIHRMLKPAPASEMRLDPDVDEDGSTRTDASASKRSR